MRRVTPRIALVGSGRAGLGLTSPWDCNVYLVEAAGETALLDAGCGLEPERIVANVERAGVDPAAIGHVLLTHSHADHSAGAAWWAREFGVTVVAPAASADALRAGDEVASNLALARAAGGYPPDFTFPPVPVGRAVADGDQVAVGPLRLEALATPGHAYDHTAYLLRDPDRPGEPALFGGDLILADGRVLLLATPDCRLDAYGDSVRRAARLAVDTLLPGHGPVALRGGAAVLRTAAGYFDRLVPPPSMT